MAKHPPILTDTEIKGVNIRGEELTLKQSLPVQLSLFQQFFGTTQEEKSNTIELYDMLPLYTPSRHMGRLREHGKYLPILRKSFRHRDQEYDLSVSPARLTDAEGNEKEYYPSEREELIEQALRKICLRQAQGMYINDMVGVQFYLRELKTELARVNHDMNMRNIIDGLTVGNSTVIEIVQKGKRKPVIRAPLFPILMLSTRDEWLHSPDTAKCYIQFNPLITGSINEHSFRQYHYEIGARISSILGRWMHRRMSHVYTYAHISKPYSIMASTIVRDSGMHSGNLRKAIQNIDAMLQEFKEKNILYCIDKDIRYETSARGQKRITDVKYTLTPHRAFTDEIVNANMRDRLLSDTNETTPDLIP